MKKRVQNSSLGFSVGGRKGEVNLKRHGKKVNRSIQEWSSEHWRELNYSNHKFDQVLYQF